MLEFFFFCFVSFILFGSAWLSYFILRHKFPKCFRIILQFCEIYQFWIRNIINTTNCFLDDHRWIIQQSYLMWFVLLGSRLCKNNWRSIHVTFLLPECASFASVVFYSANNSHFAAFIPSIYQEVWEFWCGFKRIC